METKPLLMRGSSETCRMRQGLNEFINYVGLTGRSMVEKGTFAGESAQIFAQHASLVYTIDPWVEYDEATQYGYGGSELLAARRRFFTKVMANDNDNKIRPLQLTSEQAARLFFPCSMPLVYIDGWHKHTPQDIDLWWDKVAPDGYISGHDYNEQRFPEIIESIRQRFGAPDAVFQDETWVVRKTDERIRQWQQRTTQVIRDVASHVTVLTPCSAPSVTRDEPTGLLGLGIFPCG